MADEKFEKARIAWLGGDHSDHDHPEQLYHALREYVQALYGAQQELENATKKLEERQREIQDMDMEIKELDHMKTHMDECVMSSTRRSASSRRMRPNTSTWPASRK